MIHFVLDQGGRDDLCFLHQMLEYFVGEAMASPLQKARQDPGSMKARILSAARTIFGRYGYHGATTRIIAQEVGIDISTLYYHWGDKNDLYQAVIYDISEDLRNQFIKVEQAIAGKPLAERMDLAINMMTDYLFDHPEVANLILLRYFSETRAALTWDQRVPEFASGIARSMGMAETDGSVSTQAKMRVMSMMLAIYNFVSGESFFRSMLELESEPYREQAKETLRFLLIPAFVAEAEKSKRS